MPDFVPYRDTEPRLPMHNHYDLSDLDVLLVEDNSHMRLIVLSILRALGVKNIRETGNAEDAVREMHDFDADLVICSWLMGDISGPDFVKSLRTDDNASNPYVPIIMLSSFTEKYRVTEARDAGITEFLAKPISPKTLYQRIVSIIERPRPFIRTSTFFGPCRRRRDLGPPEGYAERRRSTPSRLTDNEPASATSGTIE